MKFIFELRIIMTDQTKMSHWYALIKKYSKNGLISSKFLQCYNVKLNRNSRLYIVKIKKLFDLKHLNEFFLNQVLEWDLDYFDLSKGCFSTKKNVITFETSIAQLLIVNQDRTRNASCKCACMLLYRTDVILELIILYKLN